MTLRGRTFVRKALRMPALVSLGYHRVHVRLRTNWEVAGEASARLIILSRPRLYAGIRRSEIQRPRGLR